MKAETCEHCERPMVYIEGLGWDCYEKRCPSNNFGLPAPEVPASPVPVDEGKAIRSVIQQHRHNVTRTDWEDLSPGQKSGWAELERRFKATISPGAASPVTGSTALRDAAAKLVKVLDGIPEPEADAEVFEAWRELKNILKEENGKA